MQRQHCFLFNSVDLLQTNRMGRLYTSEGMSCQHLQVMYVCVWGVMSVRVRESVMHVGEGGVYNKIKNNPAHQQIL